MGLSCSREVQLTGDIQSDPKTRIFPYRKWESFRFCSANLKKFKTAQAIRKGLIFPVLPTHTAPTVFPRAARV